MSTLAVGHGLDDLDLELWLAGLFTAAELAAADLLLKLSVAKGIDDDDEAASSSATRSSRPGCYDSSEDLAAEEEERVVEEPAPVSTELDRRARKRYRWLSELYAATVPVTSAYSTANKKRKRHHDHDGSSLVVEAIDEVRRTLLESESSNLEEM